MKNIFEKRGFKETIVLLLLIICSGLVEYDLINVAISSVGTAVFIENIIRLTVFTLIMILIFAVELLVKDKRKKDIIETYLALAVGVIYVINSIFNLI